MSTPKSIETIPAEVERYPDWCGTRRQNEAWDRDHPEVVAQRAAAREERRRRVPTQTKRAARKAAPTPEVRSVISAEEDPQWGQFEAALAAVKTKPVPKPERFSLEEAYYRLQVEHEANRRPARTGMMHERLLGVPVWVWIVGSIAVGVWRTMQ